MRVAVTQRLISTFSHNFSLENLLTSRAYLKTDVRANERLWTKENRHLCLFEFIISKIKFVINLLEFFILSKYFKEWMTRFCHTKIKNIFINFDQVTMIRKTFHFFSWAMRKRAKSSQNRFLTLFTLENGSQCVLIRLYQPGNRN